MMSKTFFFCWPRRDSGGASDSIAVPEVISKAGLTTFTFVTSSRRLYIQALESVPSLWVVLGPDRVTQRLTVSPHGERWLWVLSPGWSCGVCFRMLWRAQHETSESQEKEATC